MSWPWSNKKSETKPTFGQTYVNATGYDDKKTAIYYKDNAKITNSFFDKNFEVSLGIMENVADYGGLCEAFNISVSEMLNLLAYKTSKLEDILKFISHSVNGKTLICNIYITSEEVELLYHSKSPTVTRPISKFLLGHNVIICVPLKNHIYYLNPVAKIIKDFLYKNDKRYPEFLINNATALFDYNQVYHDTALMIFTTLQDYQFPSPVISLFIELPAFDRGYTLTKERQVLSLILKLKALIFLIENLLTQKSEINPPEQDVTEDAKNCVAGQIISYIEMFQKQSENHFPPLIMETLYFECQYYENFYLCPLTVDNTLPIYPPYLDKSIEVAYKIVKSMPYTKHEKFWFIEVNEENSEEIQQKYLRNTWAILLTQQTKHYAKEIYNSNIIWLLSNETKWKHVIEPVLLFDGKKDFLIGLATPGIMLKTSSENSKIFIDHCACDFKGNNRAWICTKCKFFLHYLKNERVKCNCGVQDAKKITKTCFKCLLSSNVEPEHTLSPSIELNILKEIKKTHTLATSSMDLQHKNKKTKFNILFIGQSGAGKSMLVNSIHNYLTYDFDAVAKAETVNCILPCQFQLQTADYKKVEFRAGPENDNEFFNDNGESVTQKPKVYSFETEKYECSILDTPGLGDTRGAKQDQHNLNLIRETISTLDNLNAICFVMPSNISKLTANFEMIMRDLLSLFPKSALKNVFFVFTHANSSFFTIGDTRSSLDQFIRTFKETNNAEIPFHQNNVCCVDSEAFMYFIATKQGHQYQNRNEESFRLSWDKSKEAILKLLKNLKNIDPVNTKDISMIRELEDIGTLLKDETESKLESLISRILTRISEISMTSKFNSNKNLNNKPIEASMISELFKGLHLCKPHMANQELKIMIEKFIEIYGQPYMREIMEQLKVAPQPNNTEKQQTYQNGKSSYPIKAVEKEEKRICINCLKVLVNQLSNEWNEDRLPKELMEDMLNVQCVISIKPENVKKEKLVTSLKRIKKAVKVFETDVHQTDVHQVLKCKNVEHEFLKID